MTCCTFEYSVINLTWNQQYVFFILVYSNFYGIPLPDHVYTRQLEVNTKFHGHWNRQKLLSQIAFRKTEEGKKNKKKNDNG